MVFEKQVNGCVSGDKKESCAEIFNGSKVKLTWTQTGCRRQERLKERERDESKDIYGFKEKRKRDAEGEAGLDVNGK